MLCVFIEVPDVSRKKDTLFSKLRLFLSYSGHRAEHKLLQESRPWPDPQRHGLSTATAHARITSKRILCRHRQTTESMSCVQLLPQLSFVIFEEGILAVGRCVSFYTALSNFFFSLFPFFLFLSFLLLLGLRVSKCFDQLDAATTVLASCFLKCFDWRFDDYFNTEQSDVNRSAIFACVFSCTKFSRPRAGSPRDWGWGFNESLSFNLQPQSQLPWEVIFDIFQFRKVSVPLKYTCQVKRNTSR